MSTPEISNDVVLSDTKCTNAIIYKSYQKVPSCGDNNVLMKKLIEVINHMVMQCVLNASVCDDVENYEIASYEVFQNSNVILSYNNKEDYCTSFNVYGYDYIIDDLIIGGINHYNREIGILYTMWLIEDYLKKLPDINDNFYIIKTDTSISLKKKSIVKTIQE